MSNRWYLTCKDCDIAYNDGYANPQDLANLWAQREGIVAFADGPRPAGVAEIDMHDERGWLLDVSWLRVHGQHDVRVVSEYGYEFDECAVRYACIECGTFKFCGQSKGHAGGHGPRKAGV